jgi:enhancing lycopene biosynthesis protein 2
MKNQPTSELFDNLAQQTIAITSQVLAEKDQIIKDLQQKISDLEKQNHDLDCLITSGQSELRKELRELKQKLANCTCQKEEHA